MIRMKSADFSDRASMVFEELCDSLDERLIVYKRFPKKLTVEFTAVGADLPMNFRLTIDSMNELVRIISVLPMRVLAEKSADIAVAVVLANNTVPNGHFIYRTNSDEVVYKADMTISDCSVGPRFFDRMIDDACKYSDLFNDRLFDLNCGKTDITSFMP